MSDNQLKADDFWMRRALALARRAGKQAEVPVGAVLVIGDELVAQGYNKRETWKTPIGHAEVIAVHRASQRLGRWRLHDATLYVTLEPCAMCAGLLVQARLKRIVYGAADPKGGAIHSLFQIASDGRLNHRCDVTAGVLAPECSQVLVNFFRLRREQKKTR